MIRIPPYLKKGDLIGIVCPAGNIDAEKVTPCINALKKWGYKLETGQTIGNRFHNFADTDDGRLDELQRMLDNPDIKAILCARGGYGTSRIIDRISWKGFKKNPKWIIGFSDITVLHAQLFQKLKTASLHASMASAFIQDNGDDFYVQSLRKALAGKKIAYKVPPNPANRLGFAEGVLVGGNLSILVHLIGTSTDVNTKNVILFLEDVGEYLYNINRMLLQLKRAGKLNNLAGLIIGGFTEIKKTSTPFGFSIPEMINELLPADRQFPVCYDFPVSHAKENVALRVGMNHSFKVTAKGVTLTCL